MAIEKSVRKGGRQRCKNIAKDLPPDLYELYKLDLEETYGECKNRIQWIRRHWAEEWFKYRPERCREDNLFKRNFQFAKTSAKENKKALGLDFNPGPSAPRADGTRDAEPNLVGPFYNLEGLITHIQVQGAVVDHSADDADSDEAPAPPKHVK